MSLAPESSAAATSRRERHQECGGDLPERAPPDLVPPIGGGARLKEPDPEDQPMIPKITGKEETLLGPSERGWRELMFTAS